MASSDRQQESPSRPSRWWTWAWRRPASDDAVIPWLAAKDEQNSRSIASTIVASPPISATPAPLQRPAAVPSSPSITASVESVSKSTPVEPTVVPESGTGFMRYNKYIIGAASIAAFSSMMYTIHQRTKGKMRIPLQELIDNPAAAAANPKLAAYMFAGRAFGTATILVLTGTAGVAMTVASVMDVNNLKEFSIRMREIMAARFPRLKGSDEEQDKKFDPATYEFLKEVADDVEREEQEGEWREGPGHAIIGSRVRRELGPLSRHGLN
ncbi:uncharacterized protein SPPG_04447 [Spizellomyces punctatus DAOM BR117]|uniref:Altered inheritance of mitochondria protein 11 n=1 Tax=Spizellomyces punctatus (strain DAOM BR117) TaxID=645134 RepID=A0A0L0HGW6_SPIPD|nr:uncharacterized protein SPPG_04447 [Spizellomyces punctatus DAOM BR117]KND00105.1 hypothetical protein SPPG_04447 [Spizellomyces punctatus DAOM BR117]|eukprot:XP_016608144.1 hypothetical protein SPPG_04447 [Spizellomyces punctatus DAOM BR117]